ncbi:MAG: transglycosylase SLT domain-containing protein [Myxococcota bacterium]
MNKGIGLLVVATLAASGFAATPSVDVDVEASCGGLRGFSNSRDAINRVFTNADTGSSFAPALPDDKWNARNNGESDQDIRIAPSTPSARNALANKGAQPPKGCFFEGFALYESSRYATAERVWRGCLPAARNTKWHETTLWYLALTARLQNNSAVAQDLLQRLLREHPRSTSKPKYLFWLGDSLQAQRRWEHARALFALLAHEGPSGHYGLLAHRRLERMPAPAKPPLALSGGMLPAKKGAHPRDLVAAEVVPSSGMPWSGTMEHLFSQETARETHLHPTVDPPRGVSRNSYPTPWLKIVTRESKRTGVSASLAYAIMREESHFAPRARSQRGARGVMQLLPGTAKEVAREMKRKSPTIRDLYVPRRSIALGMHHLRSLKRELCKSDMEEGRCLIMTAVGFNAGRQLARRLRACCQHLPDDLLVERIPYEETREYVRKVRPSEQVYRRKLTPVDSPNPARAAALRQERRDSRSVRDG